MGAGHGGASGRYDFLREVAFKYAFLLDVMGGAVTLSEAKGCHAGIMVPFTAFRVTDGYPRSRRIRPICRR